MMPLQGGRRAAMYAAPTRGWRAAMYDAPTGGRRAAINDAPMGGRPAAMYAAPTGGTAGGNEWRPYGRGGEGMELIQGADQFTAEVCESHRVIELKSAFVERIHIQLNGAAADVL